MCRRGSQQRVLPAERARRAARPPPCHTARISILAVGCGLPCDPYPCNGGDDITLLRTDERWFCAAEILDNACLSWVKVRRSCAHASGRHSGRHRTCADAVALLHVSGDRLHAVLVVRTDGHDEDSEGVLLAGMDADHRARAEAPGPSMARTSSGASSFFPGVGRAKASRLPPTNTALASMLPKNWINVATIPVQPV